MALFNIFSHDTPLELAVDIHSHILPGIDDGAKDMAESLEMLRSLERMGYHKVITTPHVMSHRYNNATRTIRDTLAILKEEMLRNGIGIEVEAAAEYMLDTELLQRMAHDDILTFGDNYLLFEISRFTMPPNLDKLLYEVKAAGYTPVLAHPERYLYFTSPKKKYIELKEQEVLFQCNIGSFTGFYGKEVQENTKILSAFEMVDFLGSDLHSARQARYMEEVFRSRELKEAGANNLLLNNTLL